MTVHRIREASHVAVGFNQTTRALAKATVKELFLAKDADHRLIAQIIGLAKSQHIPVVWVETMKQLGASCGISVGAATAAVIEK